MNMRIRGFALAGCALLEACGNGPPPVAAESPPTPGLSPIAALGERLFTDETLSVSGRLSCQTCHRPEFAHASFTPPFGFDGEGTASGGLFRDGRARDLAAQARQPFLDPREMANPTVGDAVSRLRRSPNAARFREVFGPDVFEDSASAFAALATAIAQYEVENPDFHRFDSKYDAWLAGRATLTAAERRGLRWFEDPEKGNCAACHPNEPGADGSPPLFTDFTYDTVGLPRNAAIPANAEPAFFDLGLCGPERRDLAERRDLCGAFKVPTLRNVSRTPPYFHNGAIADLRKAVDFYARRDSEPGDWYPAGRGGTRKFDDLPADLTGSVNTTEVPYDRKPGETAALTPAEIDDIVAFLKTLDDGYN
jgi:cytochrome c peroxidase